MPNKYVISAPVRDLDHKWETVASAETQSSANVFHSAEEEPAILYWISC
jgi:hypothetical protein